MAGRRKGGKGFMSGPSTVRGSFDDSWVTRTGDHTAPLSDRISGGGLDSINVESKMPEQKGPAKQKTKVGKTERNLSGLTGVDKSGRTGTKSPSKVKDPITDQVKSVLRKGSK